MQQQNIEAMSRTSLKMDLDKTVKYILILLVCLLGEVSSSALTDFCSKSNDEFQGVESKVFLCLFQFNSKWRESYSQSSRVKWII